MPSNWLYIDTNFPTFTGEESSEEKITTIQNYMFMLVEQLRYSLHNLDLSNMNKTAVERYETSITEPIYARIEDGEENIADLAITAAGLGVRLSNAEGNITSLTATAEGLSLQISDAEDDILQLGITADGLATQISNAQGQISSLQQTVDGVLPVGIQRGEQLLPVPHQQRLYRLQRPDHLHRHGDVLGPVCQRRHHHQRGQHRDRDHLRHHHAGK